MTSSILNQLIGLVTEDRLRLSTQGSRGLLIASESDKGRVINSASFRRLQQKAQVFPLEPNASVRTRLTHSIEVSQIGRHIAQNIIELFGATDSEYSKYAAFVNTIETACLLHDIGNPPFGHLGESAIKEWFSDKNNNCQIPDLINFDGNPQGFRLISFLAGNDITGFNLTCTLLLSTVKYPWGVNEKPNGKKIGIFDSELETYKKACDSISWEVGKKFPFLRLMDVADEIAYSMSDLEDGLEKEIIDLEDLEIEFKEYKFKSNEHVLKPFLDFKIYVINKAVLEAADNFFKNTESIMNGEDVDLIPDQSDIGKLLKKVSNFARAKIYSHNDAEQVELAGRSVIKGLLNHFGELLKLKKEQFEKLIDNDIKYIKSNNLDFQIRLFRRLPKSYIAKYKQRPDLDENYRRAHLIVDFISGMTDDFALETYQILEGIRFK
jgi:dGTPase